MVPVVAGLPLPELLVALSKGSPLVIKPENSAIKTVIELLGPLLSTVIVKVPFEVAANAVKQ